MKKLSETLLECKDNVKVGSYSGSSFYYCGKGGRVASTTLKKINTELKKQSQKTKKNLEYRLANLDEIYEKSMKEQITKGKVKDVKSYKANMEKQKERERKRLPHRIASYEYDIKTPILERPVVEIVNGISRDEHPCKIIYVKGNENGKYWTIKEYQSGVVVDE